MSSASSVNPKSLLAAIILGLAGSGTAAPIGQSGLSTRCHTASHPCFASETETDTSTFVKRNHGDHHNPRTDNDEGDCPTDANGKHIPHPQRSPNHRPGHNGFTEDSTNAASSKIGRDPNHRPGHGAATDASDVTVEIIGRDPNHRPGHNGFVKVTTSASEVEDDGPDVEKRCHAAGHDC